MPATKSGLPYCTPWKNYHCEFSNLTLGNGLSEVDRTGIFATRPLTIYVNDDWPCHAPTNEWYQITGTDSGTAVDFLNLADANPLVANRYWIDGVQGTKSSWADTGGGQKGRVIQLKNTDSEIFFADTSMASTKLDLGCSAGVTTAIFTLEPGLHFGRFKDLANNITTGDYYKFKLDYDYIKNIPKVHDGTASCWFELPNNQGDIVYTETLPGNMIGHRGWSISINPIRNVPKKDGADLATSTNYNLGIALEVSNDGGTTWVKDVIFSTDIDLSAIDDYIHHANYNITAASGSVLQGDMYRFRIEFTDATGSAFHKMQVGQYIMMAIMPL